MHTTVVFDQPCVASAGQQSAARASFRVAPSSLACSSFAAAELHIRVPSGGARSSALLRPSSHRAAASARASTLQTLSGGNIVSTPDLIPSHPVSSTSSSAALPSALLPSRACRARPASALEPLCSALRYAPLPYAQPDMSVRIPWRHLYRRNEAVPRRARLHMRWFRRAPPALQCSAGVTSRTLRQDLQRRLQRRFSYAFWARRTPRACTLVHRQ